MEDKPYKASSSKLAKNTLVLYFRMLVTVGISFYTTRLLLSALGASDYGLYNVVGGVVSMLYIVTTTLTEAISRFLTYGLGTNDKEKLKDTFSTAINILLIFSSIVLFLGETVGLWFVNTNLNIDPSRLVAANWVYQFSIFSFVLEMVCIPYNSMIVAHERMKAFAFITIIDVLFKLGVAIALTFTPWDRLIFYAFLIFCIAFVRRSIYVSYSSKHFEECKYRMVINYEEFKPMMKFAGLKILSVSGSMMATTGVNILLNMFYGTLVNAAQGISSQLQNYAGSFCKNFTMALNPQITKTYAAGDEKALEKLVYNGATMSYLLFFIIACPLCFEAKFLLNVWLKEVPEYTLEFVQISLVGQLLANLTYSATVLNNAIGEIKRYEITRFVAFMFVLPLVYLGAKMGAKPYLAVVVFFVLSFISGIIAFLYNKDYVPITLESFFKNVVSKVILVSFLTVIPLLVINIYIPSSWIRLILTTIVSTSLIIITSYCCVLGKEQKVEFVNKIKLLIAK